MNIHQIDEICWLKGDWPVTAHGIGGRAANSTESRPGLRLDLHRVDLPRRNQGDRRRPLAGRTLPQRIRHLRPRHQVRGPVLRQHPRGHDAHLQGPADREGQHRLGSARGEVQSLGRRVERAAGQHPQRQAAERSQAGGLLELRRPDGPGGRPLRQDHHLGRDDELQVPVRREYRRHGLRHRAAGQARPRRLLPRAGPRRVVGDCEPSEYVCTAGAVRPRACFASRARLATAKTLQKDRQ